jgi:hypothetical protein
MTMKNAVFMDVTPCGSCNNRRFGGTSVLKEPHGVTSQKTAISIQIFYTQNATSTLTHVWNRKYSRQSYAAF